MKHICCYTLSGLKHSLEIYTLYEAGDERLEISKAPIISQDLCSPIPLARDSTSKSLMKPSEV